MSTFIDAYSTTTGQKQRIPRAWLDHPVLGKGFQKTPRQKASEATEGAAKPKTDNTKES